jgi:nucleotide-binding universal stress UspA family protein
MDDIKKILVALDFTEYSEATFNYAAKIGRNFNADLIVGSVINMRDVLAIRKIASMGYEIDGEHYVDGIKKEREKMLEQFRATSSLDPENVRLIFKTGNPVDELLKLIVQENIDMVVMGVKGRTGLEHVLVGSVADKLFHNSPVPVISFRDEKNAERLRKKIKLI